MEFWDSLKDKNKTSQNSRWKKYLIIGIAVFIIARLLNFFVAGYHSFPLAEGSPLNNVLLMTTSVLVIGSLIVIIISVIKLLLMYKKN